MTHPIIPQQRAFLLAATTAVILLSPATVSQAGAEDEDASGGAYAAIYARRILDRSDTNGDGLLEKAESERQWRSLQRSDKDTTIPVKHAYHMKERADELGAPVEIMIIRNAGHNWRKVDADIDPTLDDLVQRTVDFLEAHL